MMAVLPGGLRPQKAIAAGKALSAAGITSLAIDAGWPGSPSPTGLPGRLRHVSDSVGSPGVLCLSAGAVPIAQAQEAIWSAHLLGIHRILIDCGIFCQARSEDGAICDQLVQMAVAANAGRELGGNRLPEATDMTIGVRLPADGFARLSHYADLGAHFATIQPVYEPKRFRQLMDHYTGQLPLLAEVLVLPDASTAEALDNEVPSLQVPQALIRRLDADPAEDIRGVLRFLEHWRNRLAGVCLLLPHSRTEAAVSVLKGIEQAREGAKG